ncbi:Ubiquinol oxidase, mitochondrial-like protein [Drosera capensis]
MLDSKIDMGRVFVRSFEAAEFGRWRGDMGRVSVWWRSVSTAAEAVKVEAKEEKKGGKGENEVLVSSYWGISRPQITREDGSPWPWNCFMPWDTYHSNVSIDLKKHHAPKIFLEKFAYYTVKFLRVPTDIFFQRRYGCRAMMLETVAAVPGMVGGMLLHLGV